MLKVEKRPTLQPNFFLRVHILLFRACAYLDQRAARGPRRSAGQLAAAQSPQRRSDCATPTGQFGNQ